MSSQDRQGGREMLRSTTVIPKPAFAAGFGAVDRSVSVISAMAVWPIEQLEAKDFLNFSLG